MADDKTRILTAEDAARLAALAAEAEADDRTRVLSGDEAARVLSRAKPSSGAVGGGNAARLIGDKIVFFCANGHRIVVDKSLAGKKGNCSKQGCGVPVSIPVPPGLDVTADERPSASSGTSAEEPARADAGTGAGPGSPPELDFGATSPPTGSPAGAEPPADTGSPLWDFGEGGPEALAADPPPAVIGVPGVAGDWAADFVEIDHPTARLVARLWQERAHGGIVEVHLAGGGVILPEFYDPRWSCGDHAVFAALAPDGTVTLTAVAWNQVQRVVVRQVQGKPDGMFGD